MNTGLEKYFGGTGITLDKLKEVIPTFNVDGTHYKIEKWLKECAVFDKLIPNKSKVFIPYGGTVDYGLFKEVVWEKVYINGDPKYRHIYENRSSNLNPEHDDWWVYEPYLKVQYNDIEFYVYEVSFYKKWKRKTQMKHLEVQSAKPKRKFLSQKEIAELKKEEAISNSKSKIKN